MKKIILLFLILLASPCYAGQINQYSTGGPGGVGALSPPMSHYVNTYALVANTAQTITWPASALWCNISGSAGYWTNVDTTATVPVANATTGAASAYNIGQRSKGSESTFSIISGTNQQISIEFWGQ